MPHADDNVDIVWNRLSESRMTPYLVKANGDRRDALAMYEWSTRMAATAFEDVGHLEVLLRNALDSCLRAHFDEDGRGIPWFLMPIPGGDFADQVQNVRERLREQGKETRDQIVAGLTFGFWSGFLRDPYQELWRPCLRRAFPNAPGRREEVFAVLDGVRQFRNRIAHHDSMLGIDIPSESRRIFTAARYIDHDVADWLERRSRVLEVYAERPITIVAAAAAAEGAGGVAERYRASAARVGRGVREATGRLVRRLGGS
ncbi:hypothetical protein [Marinactinospora rubrisoli]|uniref:Abi-like protein n=1 Tax=Marinactinospora rubrisoli TaxID=2715399 RepID=A0ABW2KE67_9ACTN